MLSLPLKKMLGCVHRNNDAVAGRTPFQKEKEKCCACFSSCILTSQDSRFCEVPNLAIYIYIFFFCEDKPGYIPVGVLHQLNENFAKFKTEMFANAILKS